MPLTTATSEEITRSPSAGAERRLHVRHAADGQTSCQPVSAWTADQTKWQARILDVSLGGIGLVLPRRFERGTGLAIEVPDGPDGGHTVFARVVRVAPQGSDTWLIGCAFTGELSDEELRALTGAAADPQGRADDGATPARARPDRQPDPPARERAPMPARGMVVEDVRFRLCLPGGQAVGRHLRRLHLPGSWPLRAGAVVQARAGRGRALALRVRACERDAQGWVVTCDAPGLSAAEARRWLDLPRNGEDD
jgi:hypothetical protein